MKNLKEIVGTKIDLPVNSKGEHADDNVAKRKKQDATQKMAGLMQRKKKDVAEHTNPYLSEENQISVYAYVDEEAVNVSR